VSAAEPRRDYQDGLFETERPPESLSALIDYLSNRLGREAVTHARLVPDPQPEYACRFEPVLQLPTRKPAATRGVTETPCRPIGRRPLRLCPTPQPLPSATVAGRGGPLLRFRWEGEEYRVRQLWGPERIATGWWRGTDVLRDYYMVETDGGNRFWMFRRVVDDRWFWQGGY
jgi:protein ImuB